MQRIVGLQAGAVVFDGAASDLSDTVLTRIYGPEDWQAMNGDDDDPAAVAAVGRPAIAEVPA